MQTKYVIEVKNNQTGVTKNAYVDRMEGHLGTQTFGQAALRIQDTFPVSNTEAEKDYILKSLKEGSYREREDGARSLPEVISNFGGMTLPARSVDFTVQVFEVKSNASVSDLTISRIDHFGIKGEEGKGLQNRDKTHYEIISLVGVGNTLGFEPQLVAQAS